MDYGIVAVILLVIVLPLYFLPTIVAAVRKTENIGWVVLINVLLGWTLIGWAVALAMAVSSPSPAGRHERLGTGSGPYRLPEARPPRPDPE